VDASVSHHAGVKRAARLTAPTLFVLLASASAQAGASAHLVYVRGPGAESCPGEEAVRKAVSTRLGYDPFFAWAHDTLFVEITGSGDAYRASVKLVGDDNRLRGARDLAVKSESCGAVIGALGLTISLTIDPSSLVAPPSPEPAASAQKAESPVEPAPSPPAAAVPAPAVEATTTPAHDRAFTEPPVADRIRAYVGLGVLGSLGAEPSASAGASLFIGGSWRSLSLDLEARGDLPTTAASDAPPSRVQASLLAGSMVPCFHLAPAFGCAVVEVGRVDATSVGTSTPKDAAGLWMGAGGRAGIELNLGRDWLLRGYGELLGTVVRDTLLIGGAPAYAFPPVSGDLGIALAWRFL
jgi:hypothetical protein